MMSHVPLLAHGRAGRVLIVGGADFGLAEEVLKHRIVQKLVQVEPDLPTLKLARLHLGGREVEGDDLVQEAPDRFVQPAFAFGVAQALPRRRDVQAQALARFQPALGGQLGVGLGDRVRVDRQLLGETAHARQLVARLELAGGDLHPDRVDDLAADRARVAGGDLDHQGLGSGHCTVLSVLVALVQYEQPLAVKPFPAAGGSATGTGVRAAGGASDSLASPVAGLTGRDAVADQAAPSADSAPSSAPRIFDQAARVRST